MSAVAERSQLQSLTMLQRDPPTRWANVINAMTDAGFSLRQIAGALGVAHSTVQTWRESCPNYEDGKALLQLFDKVKHLCGPVRVA